MLLMGRKSVVADEWQVVAIIDVDCAIVGGFDAVDEEGLERLADMIGKACDWPT